MAVSSDIQLSIYNGALRRLGARKIASLSENREPRRVLDDIWDNERAVREALERGDWNFALRSISITRRTDIESSFGFVNAFDKPDDLRRLSALSSDGTFRLPLTNHQYADEGAYWLSDFDTLYVRYVSDSTSRGMDSGKWTEGFITYLECKLAFEAAERLTNSRTKKIDLNREMEGALREAKSSDSMMDGPKMRPVGGWVRSRGGGF